MKRARAVAFDRGHFDADEFDVETDDDQLALPDLELKVQFDTINPNAARLAPNEERIGRVLR